MATISLRSTARKSKAEYDVRLAVFDKDGTLIDYALMWNKLATAAVERTLRGITDAGKTLDDRARRKLGDDLLRAMGLDPQTWRSDPDGPLAVGPNDRVYQAVAVTLTNAGVENVESHVENGFIPAFTAHPPSTSVRAVGDISKLFGDLKARGVPVVVATADYRDITIKTMEGLEVAHLVDDYVCADDTQHPVKHSPEALLYQGSRFGVEAKNIMMVGDSIGDLRMAQEARVGLALGVLTGAAGREDLAPWSHETVDSIDDIEVHG